MLGTEQLLGFAAGTDERKNRLVVVATHGPVKYPLVRTVARRRSLLAAGATLAWCSYVAAQSADKQRLLAGLAITSAAHFTRPSHARARGSTHDIGMSCQCGSISQVLRCTR